MVSHETIYQYIWWDKAHGGELYKHLRHRGRRHKKRGALRKKRGTIPNRIDISERPKIVDRKNRVGDYEVDTIVGAARTQHILTLNDRKTGKVWLRKLLLERVNDVCLRPTHDPPGNKNPAPRERWIRAYKDFQYGHLACGLMPAG